MLVGWSHNSALWGIERSNQSNEEDSTNGFCTRYNTRSLHISKTLKFTTSILEINFTRKNIHIDKAIVQNYLECSD